MDRAGRIVNAQASLTESPATTVGTCVMINFPQLMERLRPYFVERVGEEIGNALRFAEIRDRYTMALGEEVFAIPSRGCATHFVFGTMEERPTPPPSEGILAEVYKKAFPIPALYYGINYV